MSEFFPLVEGRALEYDLADGEGAGVLRTAFSSVATGRGVQAAKVLQTILRDARPPEVFSYTVTKDATGVKTSAWGLEFPFPLSDGKTWRRDQADFTVESLHSRKLVPAGNFKKCLELSFLIGGGDGGGGRRFYAPGVGLVYAVNSDESDPYEYILRRII